MRTQIQNRTALLVASRSDLGYARRNRCKWQYFLPGHHQIEERLETLGLRVFSPRLIPDSVYGDVQSQVAQALDILSPRLPDSDPNLKMLLLGKLVPILQKAFLGNHLLCSHSLKISRLNSRGKVDHFWRDPAPFERKSALLSGAFGVPDGPYIADFQSPSALSGENFATHYPIRRIVVNRLSSLIFPRPKRSLFINLFFREKEKRPVEPVDFNCITADDQLAQALEAEFRGMHEDYLFFYDAYMSLFQSRPPKEAWFNFVKDVKMAAAMAALKDLGITTRFQSHGGMHVFGSAAQCRISALLSESRFNGFPAAGLLHPRGPMQEPDAQPDQQVVRANDRLVPYSAGDQAAKGRTQFRIAYIPSFIAWHSNYWGLANSCYDTFDVAAHLLELAQDLPDAELRFRIRGMRDTRLKGSRRRVMTGLDFAPLRARMESLGNVLDCSGQSYAELLDWADIVITEGITAVTYDALERRKPVLSLRASRNIRGAFAAEHPSILASQGRRALYSADIASFPKSAIDHLSKAHLGKPLADEELQGLLYLQATSKA